MKKISLKRKEKTEELPSRITNETVAEHREKILAGGRRFKYPIQYARHRLVAIAIVLAVVAFAATGLLSWWQLYINQSNNALLYRATQVVPVPVASVDGQAVRYSDYLMYYNSSVHFLKKSKQMSLDTEDAKRQLDTQKRQNLDIAIRNAYAEKLAKELNITVDQAELDRVNKEHLTMANGTISQETYNASTMSLLGWTPEEEQRATRAQLLKNNVAYAIDDKAKQQVEKAGKLLQVADMSFEKAATELGDGAKAESSGVVPLVNNDGGLTDAAGKMNIGQVSTALRSTTGNGYCFVKLLEKTDTGLKYESLCIPLTEFDRRLEELRQAGKVHEYIKIPEVSQADTKE